LRAHAEHGTSRRRRSCGNPEFLCEHPPRQRRIWPARGPPSLFAQFGATAREGTTAGKGLCCVVFVLRVCCCGAASRPSRISIAPGPRRGRGDGAFAHLIICSRHVGAGRNGECPPPAARMQVTVLGALGLADWRCGLCCSVRLVSDPLAILCLMELYYSRNFFPSDRRARLYSL
jgi:hypothetical protein